MVLDCGGADADVNPELLKHLTIISPNESELANLTGEGNPTTQTDALFTPLLSTCSMSWLMHLLFLTATTLGACYSRLFANLIASGDIRVDMLTYRPSGMFTIGVHSLAVYMLLGCTSRPAYS